MKLSKQQSSALFLGFLLAAVPVLASAQPLVPCGGTGDPCGFKDIFVLVGNIVRFLIFTVGVPLCAIAIVWGGLTVVVNPANPGERAKGLNMLKNACIGLALALASYLIVDTLLKAFATKNLEELQSEAGVTGGVNAEPVD